MASHFWNCSREMPMSRWSKGKGKKNWRPSRRCGSFFKPLLELLEDRLSPSVGATLQGTVVDDSNHDAPLSGATVTLYQQQGSNFVSTGQSVTTGANGSYSFTVAHGTYQLIKTPPAGYTNILTQITASPVESASQISSSTIQVTVPLTGTLSLKGNQYQAAGTNNPSSISTGIAPIEVLNLEVNSSSSGFVSATASAGQSIASFNGGAPFYTFCVDLGPNDTLKTGNVNNVFTVQPQTDLSGIGGHNVKTANAGKIAYLYDTYGSPNTLSSVDAAALQVAIWSLEYNQNPFLFDSTTQTIPARNNFFLTGADTSFPNSVANYSAVVSQATTYLNDGAGHSAQALFLALLGPPTSGGEQAFIVPPVSYNFSDVPKATPSINTTQQPASATVGSSPPSPSSPPLFGESLLGQLIEFTILNPGQTLNLPQLITQSKQLYDLGNMLIFLDNDNINPSLRSLDRLFVTDYAIIQGWLLTHNNLVDSLGLEILAKPPLPPLPSPASPFF
jgi:carboxypeptidase family protein